ncbi:hypothetical protein JCM8547_003695 [Rhodosporidiobolus lusitaniae]
MATTTPAPAKAPRSQFLAKLHSLLENPLDPDGLRWVTDDSFEISSKDAVAIHALSPAFEFHSLSSFIRQLSYYSFRRLSDRRRSTERRQSNTGYIVFSHPTGHFVRGDPSRLTQIVRKARNRPEKGRRVSMCSVASDDFSGQAQPPVPSMPQWQAPAFSPQYGADRLPLPSLSSLPSFVPTLHPAPRFETNVTQWRNYSPATSSWLDPNRADPEDRLAGYRRGSLQEWDLPSHQPAAYAPGLPPLAERPTQLRKAISSNEVPTLNSIGATEPLAYASRPPQQQQEANAFRTSPYPTPVFESSASTYFSQHTLSSMAGQQHEPTYSAPPHSFSSAAPTGLPSHSHLTYEPIPSHSHPTPFSSNYEPVVRSPSKSLAAVASGVPLPSPSHSPAYGSSSVSPTQSPTQGHVPLPVHGATEQPHFDPRSLVNGSSLQHYAVSADSQTVPPTDYAPPHQHQQGYYGAGAANESPRGSYSQLPRMSLLGVNEHQSQQQQQYTPYQPQQHSAQPLPSHLAAWSPAPIRTAY